MFSKGVVEQLLVTNEERIVKMVDGSTCKVISTWISKVSKRDVMMHALEAV